MMELNFNKIIRLKKIRIEKSELSEEESKLSSPLLTDKGLIPVIYDHFKDVLSEMDFPPCPDSAHQRRKFIFIILFLYAPSRLAGGKMPTGLRESLKQTLGINSETWISDNIDKTVFLFQYDKELSLSVKYIYEEIMKRLDS